MVKSVAELAAQVTELLGIAVIVCASVWVLLFAFVQLLRREDSTQIFRTLRRRLGMGILLGLEFLMGSDIIRTVAVELNFATVGVLAIIVFVRTFLSFALDVELNGRWPWQEKSAREGL